MRSPTTPRWITLALCTTALFEAAAMPPLMKNTTPELEIVRRTPAEQKAFVEKLDWFYQAKYGLMYDFFPNMHRFRNPKTRIQWTSEKWNRWVDAVDVEKIAEQAEQVGAGYVIWTIGQGGGYVCAPNPVMRELFGLKPGQCESRRDLPMDLYHALKKRGIPLMLYTSCDGYLTPGPNATQGGWLRSPKVAHKADQPTPEGCRNMVKVVQWYSEHYGDKVKGWWLDGLRDYVPNYTVDIHRAARSGNPNTIVASGSYQLSDFLHGQCVANWKKQQKYLPEYGRWDETYGIQWQVYQYLGKSWGERSAAHSTQSMVNYATKVIEGGGVFTFDVGTFTEGPKRITGPHHVLSEPQLKQLLAVKKAVAQIKSRPPANQPLPQPKAP
jgi:hypothetical protein